MANTIPMLNGLACLLAVNGKICTSVRIRARIKCGRKVVRRYELIFLKY